MADEFCDWAQLPKLPARVDSFLGACRANGITTLAAVAGLPAETITRIAGGTMGRHSRRALREALEGEGLTVTWE